MTLVLRKRLLVLLRQTGRMESPPAVLSSPSPRVDGKIRTVSGDRATTNWLTKTKNDPIGAVTILASRDEGGRCIVKYLRRARKCNRESRLITCVVIQKQHKSLAGRNIQPGHDRRLRSIPSERTRLGIIRIQARGAIIRRKIAPNGRCVANSSAGAIGDIPQRKVVIVAGIDREAKRTTLLHGEDEPDGLLLVIE